MAGVCQANCLTNVGQAVPDERMGVRSHSWGSRNCNSVKSCFGDLELSISSFWTRCLVFNRVKRMSPCCPVELSKGQEDYSALLSMAATCSI